MTNSKDKRILATGITSIHGWPIWEALKNTFPIDNLRGIRPPKMSVPNDHNVQSVCISDKGEIDKFLYDFHPTHVIHCSGVCDLDVCEERPQWANNINVKGAKNIYELYGKSASILFLSTDLVFSGNTPPKNGYTETHTPDPVSIAGKTFVEAEETIKRCQKYCIIRLGLPVGKSITGDKGGHDWIESRFKKGLPVTLFTDEWRSCVSCDAIAAMILQCLERDLIGLFHFGGPHPLSLFELGNWIRKKGNYPKKLLSGIRRCEEINGPPRIGNVTLNSKHLLNQIKLPIEPITDSNIL